MIGVNVAIVRDGAVLLTRREDFDVWCLPGGHVDDGETFADAACREVREETGLEVVLTRLVGLYSRRAWQDGYHIAVFAGRVTGGALQPDPAEVVEVRTFPVDALPPAMMLGHRQRILDTAAGREGIVRRERIAYPASQPLERHALYALRDASGLPRADYYGRHFGVLEDGPGVLDVGGESEDLA